MELGRGFGVLQNEVTAMFTHQLTSDRQAQSGTSNALDQWRPKAILKNLFFKSLRHANAPIAKLNHVVLALLFGADLNLECFGTIDILHSIHKEVENHLTGFALVQGDIWNLANVALDICDLPRIEPFVTN